MNINRKTDEEISTNIELIYMLNPLRQNGYAALTQFIRQCVKDSCEELIELIDGADPIISIWKTESPGQVKFKELWLAKAHKALASVEKEDNHVA